MASMYFIAIVLPPSLNQQILKWKMFMKEHFNCEVALRSPAHITLVPPFWMNDELENKSRKEISLFSNHQKNFEISLKDFAAFKPRVIYVDVLPNTSLQNLHLQLQEFFVAQTLFPIKKEERSFHPHVTIATRDLHKKSFHEAWEIFKEKKFEASSNVNGISLLKHNQKNWDVVFTSQFPN
jgi:2'-5' RNA ligase